MKNLRLLLTITVLTSLVGCVNGDDYGTPDLSNECISIPKTKEVSEITSLAVGTATQYTTDENLVDYNDKPLDCSGRLYKESNYVEGKLEGVQKRYSLLEKNKVPCKQGEENDEGCYETVCIYFNEIATYSDDKLNGAYEIRGPDNELWSKGFYLNGKETGKFKVDYFNQLSIPFEMKYDKDLINNQRRYYEVK